MRILCSMGCESVEAGHADNFLCAIVQNVPGSMTVRVAVCLAHLQSPTSSNDGDFLQDF